jgi:hypothetical protein
MNTPLTKQDVARRQLATAIQLHFEGRDLVSIFSLAANAWEIIDALCEVRRIESFSRQVRENVPQGKDLKRHYINSPYRNFFKHADHDPDATVPKLSTANVDAIIFLGVEDYLRLFERAPVEFQAYQLWYLATNPDKLAAERLADVLESTNDIFPGILDLPRGDQLSLGKRALQEAMSNAEILADPRTEPTW